jgi:hypothetical protein
MKQTTQNIDVYLEAGAKKVFACAVDWPGWSRAGRDEAAALQALFDYAPRYAAVLRAAGIDFTSPANVVAFKVSERLEGNATTDFGAPGVVPACDAQAISAKELPRMQSLLQAYWQAYDAIEQRAAGKPLQTGPRGGGRDLLKLAMHVTDAEAGYLSRLSCKPPKMESDDPIARRLATRRTVLDALESAVKDGLPEKGPRGGKIWPARYFVRRVGWHVLDHLWEVEDRLPD